MLVLARRLAISSIICFLIPVSTFSRQQARKQSNQEFLATKRQKLQNYAKDFIEFGHSHKDNAMEREADLDLSNVVQTALDYVTAAQHLLEIHSTLSCQADRDKTFQLIRRDLSYYAGILDLDVQLINTNLSFARTPAVAVSGTQMKDDLREIKTFFESIRPNE